MKNAPIVNDQSAKNIHLEQVNYNTNQAITVHKTTVYSRLPSDAEIQKAITDLQRAGVFNTRYFYHESNDSTRIAYAWFDAQKTVRTGQTCLPVKHMIESWGRRYCSTDSVIVAAYLHPRIKGTYPSFNLSARLTLPAFERLYPIDEAGIHPDYAGKYPNEYAVREVCHD